MLGFFDSGIGWLEVMKVFRKEFPNLDMVFFGDRANCPYGDKPGEEIAALTEAGVKFLFDKWAKIVIIACNTGAAYSIRRLQTEIYPWGCGKQVLSVTVPGTEQVFETGCRKVGVLATKATVQSWVYSERIKLLDPSIEVQEIPAPGLVNLIEADSHDKVTIRELLDIYLRKFSPDIDALILGCTHYPIIQNEIAKAWKKLYGKPVEIIDPAEESAKRFVTYLKRHPEYKMGQGGTEQIYFS